MTSDGGFWGALARRKVLRTLGIYLAGAWLVLQVVEIFAEMWSWPNWVLQATFILLVLSLPIVAVLSWLYDVTAAGLVESRGFLGILAAPAADSRADRSAYSVPGSRSARKEQKMTVTAFSSIWGWRETKRSGESRCHAAPLGRSTDHGRQRRPGTWSATAGRMHRGRVVGSSAGASTGGAIGWWRGEDFGGFRTGFRPVQDSDKAAGQLGEVDIPYPP